MNYDYPILKKVIKYYKELNGNSNDFCIVSCQHLLGPQVEMYKGFIEIGVKPENIIALGKAYSTNNSVLEELNELGVKAIQPKFSGKAFDEEHRENCSKIINSVFNKNIIVLDDGAEMILASSHADKNILFAVEQTSSGFRKIESIDFDFPIVNVARSKTKLTQESPLIARLCFERINKELENININNPTFLLIGLGPIGESIKEIIVQDGYKINGYDVNDYESIFNLLNEKKPNIVIGATGSQIIKKGDLERLDKNHHFNFVSVSSSDREFSVADFRDNSNVHQNLTYNNFTFINNGFPITFMGNRIESTPMEIEKTICLLFGSVAHGIKKGYVEKGLIDVSKELEDLINS